MGLIELLIIILVIAWLTGWGLGGIAVGGLIHLILVIAILLFLWRLFSTGFYGRRGPRGDGEL